MTIPGVHPAWIALALSALLLPLPAARLWCQHPDVLLSPDPITHELPDDAQMQSLGMMGGRMLAVFGTTARASDSTIVNQLRLQILEDTLLAGTQRVLTGADARPYSVVAVVAIDTTFLVFWNDRREGAPGIYMRPVDTNGEFAGEERFFSSGILSSSSGIVLIPINNGAQLFWNDGRVGGAGIYRRRLSSAGAPLDAEEFYGTGEVVQGLRYTGLNGRTLVRRQGGTALVVDEDGSIQTRTVIRDLNRPYYIGTDRLLVLNDTILSVYRTLTDSLPIATYNAPQVRSAFAGLVTVSIDSQGFYQVYFPVVQSLGTLVSMSVHGISINPEDGNVSNRYYDGANPYLGGSYQWVKGDRGSWVNYYCDNRYETVVRFDIGVHSLGSTSDQTIPIDFSYAVQNGHYIKWVEGVLTCDSCRRACGFSPLPNITRISDSKQSTVLVGRSTTLTAPSIVAHVPIPETIPNVFERDGRLFTTWRQETTTYRGALYMGIYTLGSWNGSADSVAPLFNMSLYTYASAQAILGLKVTEFRSPYGTAISSSSVYNTPILLDAYHTWSNSYNYRLYVATTSGWKASFETNDFKSSNSVDVTPAQYVLGYGFNPENESQAFFRRKPQPSGGILSADGTLGWSNPVAVAEQLVRGTIPVGDQDLILVVADSLKRFHLGTQVSSKPLHGSAVGDNGVFQRSFGPYFLRASSGDSGRSTLVERFDMDGNRVDSLRLAYSGTADLPAIVQNPADSSIALLTAGERGIRLSYTRRNLELLRDTATGELVTDLQLGQTSGGVKNVAAAFRHDTLFFVWEDFRNGDPDIYGNYWAVPKTLQKPYRENDTTHSPNDSTLHPPIDSTEHTDRSTANSGELAIRSVAPNPATTYVDVRFLVRTAGNVDLELYDLLGRRIGEYRKPVATGEQVLRVDMTGLAPGSYMIVLRSEHGLDRRRVVVN